MKKVIEHACTEVDGFDSLYRLMKQRMFSSGKFSIPRADHIDNIKLSACESSRFP
jgi:hypothetical protein